MTEFPEYMLRHHRAALAREAIGKLGEALARFEAIGAYRTAGRVRLAISSAKGAYRHARRKDELEKERSRT